MPPPKTRLGVGAKVSCLLKFLHPFGEVRKKFPNTYKTDRISNLTVTGQAAKLIRSESAQCFTFCHDDFPDVELYTTKPHAKCEEEGPPESIFGAVPPPPPEPQQPQQPQQRGEIHAETVRVDGVELGPDQVDNDDEPAPENVGPAPTEGGPQFSNWGEGTIDPRVGQHDTGPRLKTVPAGQETNLTPLQLFLLFFPVDYIKEVLLPATIAADPTLADELSFGCFLRFLGLILIISCYHVQNIRSWFSTQPPHEFDDAPFRLNHIMSRNLFNRIRQALRFNKETPPEFQDKFWEVRPLFEHWNRNMDRQFEPGPCSCLDESMSPWFNPFTCPGFMFVPRKPHPFGNEYHTICCAKCGIMYRMEIVEGKDRPHQMGPKEYDEHGSTVGLMVRMTKSIWHTGKYVVMDSGFCVLQGLLEMLKKGVFGHAQIKKRRYWPKWIKGDEVNEHFENKEVGQSDAKNITWEGKQMRLFALKEPDYVTMIMSTYGSLREIEQAKTRRDYKDGNGQPVRKEFYYPEPFYNHYKKRGFVDTHNSRRHQPLSIEETMGTHRWEFRVFMYHLAVSEINALYGYHHFVNAGVMSTIEFRKVLAKALINNDYLDCEQSQEGPARKKTRFGNQSHVQTRPPAFTGAYDFTKKCWKKVSTEYLQRHCVAVVGSKRCYKKTRYYCSCSEAMFLCDSCFSSHVSDVTQEYFSSP